MGACALCGGIQPQEPLPVFDTIGHIDPNHVFGTYPLSTHTLYYANYVHKILIP